MSERVFGGRYRVGETLGRGGMATVYRGTDSVLGRAVAIKVLAPQFASDPSFVDRFRREAQAAARLNHPNLVGVYDTGSDDGTHFIVMEYVEGRTLEDFLSQGGRLMPARAIEVASAVCDGLAYAHRAGVIHRDIKSGNIMVTKQGRVKVMDFGIARITTTPDTIAQTAAVLGTAGYLSPEQAQGEPVDARTDIYSLGIVLFEMVVGHVPFRGDSAVAVAYKQVHDTPGLPSRENPDVSPALDAVVMRALAKNPANRYQAAEELKADLERAARGEPVEATPLLPTSSTQVIARPPSEAGTTQALPPQAPPPRRRWGWGIAIGVLIAAALGAGLYFLAQALLGNEVVKIAVPSVIGKTQEDAISELKRAGFIVPPDSIEKSFSEKPKGTVIAQDPAPAALAEKGSAVSITVSKGPQQVKVPDLSGDTLDEAQAELRGAGLDLGGVDHQATADPAQIDRVVDQFPKPNERVDKGSSVTIVLGAQPQQVVVPDVTCTSFGHARSSLEHAGFTVVEADFTEFNAECPQAGRVARTDPPANSTASMGSTVTIIGSQEPPTPTPTPT